jgi:hypothetical protein
MKSCLPLFALLLLAGCAATDTLPDRPLTDGQAYLVPLHVMVDDPLRAAELRNALRATGVFENVQTGAGEPGDYSARIQFKSDHEIPAMPLIFLSAATLFLMPLSNGIDTRTDITLLHEGKVLKQYSYRNLTHKYTWLLDQGGEMQEQNIQRIARAFAGDLRQDQLLPSASQAQ